MGWLLSIKLLSKSNILFFGYFDHINIFLVIKINNCRGDVRDISAKTAALVGLCRDRARSIRLQPIHEDVLRSQDKTS